jgi:hypothetical protein
VNDQVSQQDCDEFAAQMKEKARAEIEKMRQEIEQALVGWRNAQPDCWEQYRQNAEYWKQARAFGGLGLSGIGEGGGGRGEGIGLGSIGTIGHGAGTGSGQGFGSGHGRLGGSHSAASPNTRNSRTNVQVDGVDEADLVKTDGSYVYFAVNGALRIATVDPPRVLSVTAIEGKVKEMFVEGNRAVVYSALGGTGEKRCTYGYDCTVRGDGSRTRVHVFDVSNRAHPIIRRTFELSGSLIASRRIDNAIHTVVVDGQRPDTSIQTWPDSLPTCGIRESAVKKRLTQLAESNERSIRAAYTLPTLTENGKARTLCSKLFSDKAENHLAFTTIFSFDLSKEKGSVYGASFRSQPGTVYASRDALYLSVRKYEAGYGSRIEKSDVHKFRISQRPTDTTYLASGKVPGRVLNQFAMDEWQGHLRIATTQGYLPNPNVESQVHVLAESNGSLESIGAIKHLAPGEDIRSVRFDADRAYIVTFKKTDPLFVLDFQNPKAPKILGELKIPGFSTYLHRISPNHLLSIGFDADDQGGFAYFNGLLLQIFDVSNLTAPKRLHREKIGTRGSASEAITNHLAFNYLAEDGLLAIPATLCEGGGNGRFGNQTTFSGLLVYEVNVNNGFRKVGGINHGRPNEGCHTWWSQSTSDVKRSLFIGDQVWSIATNDVKVRKLATLESDWINLRLGQ